MLDRKVIEEIVIEKFLFLNGSHGFNKPISKRENWSTTISYLSKEIAIEFEIDLRECSIFVLVTKLDKGKLPKGYYMSKGRLCRIHIEEILQKKFGISRNEIQDKISSINKKRQKRNQEYILSKINSYQKIIKDHVCAICNAGESLFE